MSSSSSCSSSIIFVCLFLVLVLVPSLVSKKQPNPMGFLFLVICRMLEVKEHLTTVLELEWENLNVAQRKY